MLPDRCRDDILAELDMIARELSQYEPMLRKVRVAPPDHLEINSLAMLLHAFYNGVENVFKSIARHIDENKLTSVSWHRELLALMAQTAPHRPAVISPELRATLSGYLGFRHIVRHAYPSQFNWELMQGLVDGIEGVANTFRSEISLFLTQMEQRP